MSNTDVKEWYKSIPPITKAWFTAITVVPLAGRFNLISPYYLWLVWDFFFYQGQIWRPLTATVYYPISPQTGFHYLITVYFIYNYSYLLETGVFKGRPADFVFLLFFAWVNCIILALALSIPILLDMSMFVVLYIWCMVNKDEIVSFWFGTKFKAAMFPWILLAFRLIISGEVIPALCGICVGHLYFFLKYKYPIDFGGRSFLETPSFLYQYFPSRRMTAGFTRTSQPLRAAGGDEQQYRGRHVWGAGRRLED